jgi:hypothetical protein
MVPLEHLHQVLCQEEGPTSWRSARSRWQSPCHRCCRYRFSMDQGPATPLEGPHTTPRLPHPGSGSTCPQALPVIPPPIDGESPQTPRWPRQKVHVKALHQGHHNMSPTSSIIIRWPRTNLIPPACLSPTRGSPTVVSLAPHEPML